VRGGAVGRGSGADGGSTAAAARALILHACVESVR